MWTISLKVSNCKRSAPLIKTLRSLPPFLLLAFCVFALTPLLSLSFMPLPWQAASDPSRTGWQLSLLIFSYWVGPLALCLTLLRRSIMFLAIFLVECAALTAQTLAPAAASSSELVAARLFLIALVTGIGLLFLTRDAIYPLLQRRSRWWRKNPRLSVNTGLNLTVGGATALTILENCSASGLAVSGEKQSALAAIGLKGRGGRGFVELRRANLKLKVPVEVVWFREEGPLLLIGLCALDSAPMLELIRIVAPRQRVGPVQAWISQFWVRTSLQRLMMGLWFAAMLGSVGTPACGSQKDSKDEPPPAADEGIGTTVVSAGQPTTERSGNSSGGFVPLPATLSNTGVPATDPSDAAVEPANNDQRRVVTYNTQGFRTMRYAEDVPTEADTQAWNPVLTPSRVTDTQTMTTDYGTKVVERD